MPTTLKMAVVKYLRAGDPAAGTRAEYFTTLRKWKEWGGGVPIEKLGRREIREFLDWVYERAVAQEGINPGRTANKAREHLRAIVSWGWLFYRRVKTGKAFYRPMNRVVHAHITNIMPEEPNPDDPVFLGGGSRPNARFRELCDLTAIKRKRNVETGAEEPWVLKDLRKTCATYYDEHVPESSIEILGHSVGGITYRHYAHRAPLAFKAIMSLPQPSSFWSLLRGHEGECPCCRRPFADAP